MAEGKGWVWHGVDCRCSTKVEWVVTLGWRGRGVAVEWVGCGSGVGGERVVTRQSLVCLLSAVMWRSG